MTTTGVMKAPLLEELSWDSGHFGFPVARWNGGPETLSEGLKLSRFKNYQLVYWSTCPSQPPSETLLDAYRGALVTRKATFVLDPVAQPDAGRTSNPFQISPWSKTREPDDRLVRLAIQAGENSRFRVDRRIPIHAMESLYSKWIAGSASGLLADVLLVATIPGSESDPIGLITITIKGEEASIGLLAVHAEFRGKGAGFRLLEEAHRWILSRGCRRVSVVTQKDNLAACRLYEKHGYQLANLEHVYHFWPADGSGAVSDDKS